MVKSVGSEIGPKLKILVPIHTGFLCSVTQFPNLKHGDKDSTYLIGSLNGINKIMQTVLVLSIGHKEVTGMCPVTLAT